MVMICVGGDVEPPGAPYNLHSRETNLLQAPVWDILTTGVSFLFQ